MDVDHTLQNHREAPITAGSISSKLPSRRSENEFYRYYAGYPLQFAEWALKKLELPPGASVLDPWHGSGTTAAACARMGFSCQGYDLNPVMVHLARARVAACVDFQEAEELICAVEKSLQCASGVNIRRIGRAFREFPIGNEIAHSVAISALFPYARGLLSMSKTKNPSWFKVSSTIDDVRLTKSEFFASWHRLVQHLRQWWSVPGDPYGITISIHRGDSRKSLGRSEAFSGLLTSPPYLTRLDYVQATLPELLLLKEFATIPDLPRLRRSMLGSPLTSERPAHSLQRLPRAIRTLLDDIRSHPSKASATYYHRFFSTYFVDLYASIRNIAKVLKRGARGCIVVQSSHYKEIEIDLAEATLSLAELVGLRHEQTIEFDCSRSISLVNSRAHENARKPKKEFAVFLRKE